MKFEEGPWAGWLKTLQLNILNQPQSPLHSSAAHMERSGFKQVIKFSLGPKHMYFVNFFLLEKQNLTISAQVDGEVLTIEIPETLVKQWESKEEFKTYHAEFLGRNPTLKELKVKSKKGGTVSSSVKNPKNPVNKRKQAPLTLSSLAWGIFQVMMRCLSRLHW